MHPTHYDTRRHIHNDLRPNVCKFEHVCESMLGVVRCSRQRLSGWRKQIHSSTVDICSVRFGLMVIISSEVSMAVWLSWAGELKLRGTGTRSPIRWEEGGKQFVAKFHLFALLLAAVPEYVWCMNYTPILCRLPTNSAFSRRLPSAMGEIIINSSRRICILKLAWFLFVSCLLCLKTPTNTKKTIHRELEALESMSVIQFVICCVHCIHEAHMLMCAAYSNFPICTGDFYRLFGVPPYPNLACRSWSLLELNQVANRKPIQFINTRDATFIQVRRCQFSNSWSKKLRVLFRGGFFSVSLAILSSLFPESLPDTEPQVIRLRAAKLILLHAERMLYTRNTRTEYENHALRVNATSTTW